jgi:hypothetical protein
MPNGAHPLIGMTGRLVSRAGYIGPLPLNPARSCLRAYQVGPDGTMAATHGCLTSMKGDAMTLLSRDGRAAQTGKETALPRSRPRLRGLASRDHLTLDQACAGQRHRAGPTYLARDSSARAARLCS